MVKQQVVSIAVVHELAIIARSRFEARVGGFDKDLGLVAGGAQDTLDAEHFVADRIAVSERGEHLVDTDHARFRSWSEAPGNRSSTSSAGARSSRRRSLLPGSGSIMCRAGVALSCASMSRYFRS